jgi:hypothetical protein
MGHLVMARKRLSMSISALAMAGLISGATGFIFEMLKLLPSRKEVKRYKLENSNNHRPEGGFFRGALDYLFSTGA